MFAPRTIAAKSKAKDNALPSAASLAPAMAPREAAPPAVVTETPEAPAVVDEAATARRHADILFAVEVCLSDWGLWLRPALLERLAQHAEGYVHLSNLLAHEWLASFETTQPELATAIGTSELLELDDGAVNVRRKSPVDQTALAATTVDDWASRTVYLENLPNFASVATRPAEVRTWLGELLGTTVQTVRLPPLFAGKESTEGGQQRTAGEPLYDDTSLDKDERARRRTFRLPDGGGPFKGFAFAVLGDNAAAERARTDWAWDRAAVVPAADDEESADESDVAAAPPQELSLVEQSQRRGLRIMPITEWNNLRGLYLSYQRTLSTLQDSRSRERDSDRHRSRSSRHDDRSSRRDDRGRSDRDRCEHDAPPPERDLTAARWGHIERSPTPPGYRRAPLEFQADCVVFIRNLNPAASRQALVDIFRAILDKAGCSTAVAYVDYERGLDACHVRVEAPDAAVILRDYFTSQDLEHDTPTAPDLDAFSMLTPGEEGPVGATVIGGEREAIYWRDIIFRKRKPERDGDDDARTKRRREER